MLATTGNEVRCGRCRRALPARDAEHRCRTMDEQIETLRALSQERRVSATNDPRAAMAMREKREVVAPQHRRDVA